MNAQMKNIEACDCLLVVGTCIPYRCPKCGAKLANLRSDVQKDVPIVVKSKKPQAKRKQGRALATVEVHPVTEIAADAVPRLMLDMHAMHAMDAVLGGGVVEGGVYLLGGEPGIGKSTLLMQIAQGFLKKKRKVLYISAEETLQRARERAERLGVLDDNLLVCVKTELHQVLNALRETKADVLLLDSIQRIHDVKLASQTGSPMQVRRVCEALQEEKAAHVTLFIVGHVTKGGKLAGPKVLEHLVDVVMHFCRSEGEGRALSTSKNRFGPCAEVALTMTADGLSSSATVKTALDEEHW